MTDWKQRLYNSYISTGQQSSRSAENEELRLQDFPDFTRIIEQHLPADRTIAIADLACGHGPLLFCLKQMGYQNVQGVDVSPEQVALAHSLGVSEVACMDINSFLEDKFEAFDVVFLMDILEHLTRPELFSLLDKVHLSLRPGGLMIIHVPNAEGLFGMRVRYGDLTHENSYTPRSMRQALRLYDFRNIQFFEDRPPVNGLKGFVRYLTWMILVAPIRLMLLAEVGAGDIKHILSQNMLVMAERART